MIFNNFKHTLFRFLNFFFRILFFFLPFGEKTDNFYHLINFYLNHKRLPSNKKLFNDILYTFKVSKESSYSLQRLTTEKDNVKLYVKSIVGDQHNVKTYKVINSIDELYRYEFPLKCCIKPTNSCGEVFLRKKGEKLPFKLFESWLKINYYKITREKNYKDLENKIIIEELLEDRLGEGFFDYKVFCYKGKANLIQVTVNRYTDRSRVFYNASWEKQDFTISVKLFDGEVEKPENLKDMLYVAEKLSAPFNLVRIDLFSDNKNCLLGEITHCHGQAHEPFIPLSSEYKASKLFLSSEDN